MLYLFGLPRHRVVPDGSSIDRDEVADTAGNVEEWVQDRYAPDDYAHSPVHNPRGPATGSFMLPRGRAGSHHRFALRTARRSWLGADDRHAHIGFRCATSRPAWRP